MTVLNAIQKACAPALGLSVPATVYGSTTREHVELGNIANTVADDLLKDYDWQLLSLEHTINGDGVTTEFDLPADYDRMLKKGRVWSSRIQTPYRHILDLDEWLEIEVRSFEFVVGVWNIHGGKIHLRPAPATGEVIKFFYISNLIVRPSSGADKAAFTADSDVFRIDEELLRRGVIWRWRSDKGLPYGEDLEDYEMFKAHLIDADKGSKMLRFGRRRGPSGARVSYPTVITP